jgi:hypothetical protein
MSKSVYNNSVTPLAAGESFIGTDEKTYDLVTIACIVMSSTDGRLVIKQTDDPSAGYPIITTFVVTLGLRQCFGQPISKKYYHVEFTNLGLTTQTYLSVDTVLYTNYEEDSKIQYADSVSSSNILAVGTNNPLLYDAFGRLRVSNPKTLLDSSNIYRENQVFDTYTINGGSSTYDSNTSTVSMTISGSTGGTVVSQTKQVYIYQPGKSLLILSTFLMNTPTTGLTQRVGYFGEDTYGSNGNGIYLESNGTTLSLNIKKQGVVTETATQSQWNSNQLLIGNIILDITKVQIFWIDIEWLGVGSVRCGFIINGQYILCHTFHHTNIITSTYIRTACLPVRYEIIGTNGVTGTLKRICSTVISEGGFEPVTASRHAILNGRQYNVVTGLVPLVSIRLKSTRLGAIVIPSQTAVLIDSNINTYYTIVVNGTISGGGGGSWVDYSAYSSVQINTTYSTGDSISGGTELNSGLVNQQGGSSVLANASDFNTQIGKTILGVSDVVTLCIYISGSTKVYAMLGWYEPI